MDSLPKKCTRVRGVFIPVRTPLHSHVTVVQTPSLSSSCLYFVTLRKVIKTILKPGSEQFLENLGERTEGRTWPPHALAVPAFDLFCCQLSSHFFPPPSLSLRFLNPLGRLALPVNHMPLSPCGSLGVKPLTPLSLA